MEIGGKTRKGRITGQIKTTERNGMDGNSYKTHGNGREQAGMSQEGRRTIGKVRENMVHDTGPKIVVLTGPSQITFCKLKGPGLRSYVGPVQKAVQSGQVCGSMDWTSNL